MPGRRYTLLLFTVILSSVAFGSETYRMIFSDFEKQIEEIAWKYPTNREKIDALEKLRDQNPVLLADNLAYYLGYRCVLFSIEKDASQITASFKQLAASKWAQSNAMLAAKKLCESYNLSKENYQKNYDKLIEEAFRLVRKSDSAVLHYWISAAYAQTSIRRSLHHDALEAAHDALTIAIENQDAYRIAETKGMMAISEGELGFSKKALDHNADALSYARKKGWKRRIMTLLMDRGYLLLNDPQDEKAEPVFEEALALSIELGAESSTVSMKTNLAAIALRKKNYDQVLKLTDEIFQYARGKNYQNLIAHANSISAVVFLHRGDRSEAESRFLKGNQYFIDHDMTDALADNYSGWAEEMAAQKDYETAYRYSQLFYQTRMKIMEESRDAKLLQLQKQLETEQKNAEIKSLSNKNKVQQSELEINELKERNLWLLAAVILLLGLFVLLMYVRATKQYRAMAIINKKLDRQRYVDALTKAKNRRFLEQRLFPYLLHQINDENKGYTFCMLDIDHFKIINDTYGHASGDRVLMELSLRLFKAVRGTDSVIRMGGEEFVVVSENENAEQSQVFAEKLRCLIADEPFTLENGQLDVTISLGICFRKSTGVVLTTKDLIAAVKSSDSALYEAKESGRNRYCIN